MEDYQMEHDMDYGMLEYSDSMIDTDSDYSESALTAQQQWDESVKQITGLFNLVLLPLLGKILGRRMSKVIWAKFADWYW